MTVIATYHNDESIKAEHVMLAMFHRESDRLRSGAYGDVATGLGCSVGCFAMDRDLSPNDHAGLARAVGLPEWLVRLQDSVFEGLPESARADWHVAIAEAVPVGVDLQPAYHRICARILREVAWPASRPDDEWGCAQAVRLVASLHDAPGPAEWAAAAAAQSAAQSAAAAAEWAAAAAGWAAWAAAAARAAARAAEWSAAAAAEWSAAAAAEWSAAAAAEWSAEAARSAEWVRISKIVLTEVAR